MLLLFLLPFLFLRRIFIYLKKVTAVLPNNTQYWAITAPGGNRVWADIAVAQIDGIGLEDVVVAWSGGYVGAFDIKTGAVLSTFNGGQIKQISIGGNFNEFRSLAVRDMDGDGKAEIAVGMAVGYTTNAVIVDNTGAVMSGWPAGPTNSSSGYAWGVYSDSGAILNMDADAQLEYILPSDVTYICAYKLNAAPLPVPSGIWAGTVSLLLQNSVPEGSVQFPSVFPSSFPLF